MICDWCIRALRGTEKFRALVHAAFEPTASASDMAIDTDGISVYERHRIVFIISLVTFFLNNFQAVL